MYLLKNIRNYRFYYKFVIKSLIFNIFFLVSLPDVYIFRAGTALSPRLCLVPSVVKTKYNNYLLTKACWLEEVCQLRLFTFAL